ncbi:MOSC domain-containing protein [Pseudactinotalea terrae]|uniref:MOSC domain-containing protein n=1 Tax=Pseudactinotalea terrae TaxID=1743262 RepID=UPI0012E198DC|nr:MOSC domain-containing protein [Pseudactinotalea terrae]
MSDDAARVVAVSRLFEVRETDRPGYLTAIDKRPVPGPVVVGELGVEGDQQVDHINHGGPDKAVYAYAAEDLARWAEQLGRELGPGMFGENLTTAGVDVTGAVIGERWAVGDGGLLLEVTMPRTPCYKFAHKMGEPRWIKRFNAEGRPGAYLRVLQPGPVAAGDRIEVGDRPAHGVTIGQTFLDPQPEMMAALRQAEAAGDVRLAPPLRERIQYLLEKAESE